MTVGELIVTLFRHYFDCLFDILIIDLGKFSRICLGCIFHVDRHLAYNRNIQLSSDLIYMTLTKDLEFFAAVRAFYITVVLYDSKYRDLHHSGHVVCLLHNHLDQILR